MKKTTTQQGFTIIETLVAITILMVAIAGPLSIASKGLSGALASRDQMIAAYLAQESMEVIKNLRDNNVYNNPSDSTKWLQNSNLPGGFPSCFRNGGGNRCDASVTDTPGIITGSNTFPLKLTSTGYSHGNSGTATPFSRYLYLSKPWDPNTQCDTTDSECTVTVVVDWYEGRVPYQVVLSSQLVNAAR